jgi:signal peptidase I
LVPTTSDMKFIPVDKTMVWEMPTKGAIIYITQPELWVNNNIDPRAITQMIVPVLNAVFLPNLP